MNICLGEKLDTCHLPVLKCDNLPPVHFDLDHYFLYHFVGGDDGAQALRGTFYSLNKRPNKIRYFLGNIRAGGFFCDIYFRHESKTIFV